MQIAQEAAPLPDHLQEAAAARVVVDVGAEVPGQAVDALGQQGDLDCGRSGVSLVLAGGLYSACRAVLLQVCGNSDRENGEGGPDVVTARAPPATLRCVPLLITTQKVS